MFSITKLKKKIFAIFSSIIFLCGYCSKKSSQQIVITLKRSPLVIPVITTKSGQTVSPGVVDPNQVINSQVSTKDPADSVGVVESLGSKIEREREAKNAGKKDPDNGDIKKLKDKITISKYRITYPGPQVNVFASLDKETEGIRVFCTTSCSSSFVNSKAVYKKNVKLSKQPTVIMESLSQINSEISIKYIIKKSKKASDLSQEIKINLTMVMS